MKVSPFSFCFMAMRVPASVGRKGTKRIACLTPKASDRHVLFYVSVFNLTLSRSYGSEGLLRLQRHI